MAEELQACCFFFFWYKFSPTNWIESNASLQKEQLLLTRSWKGFLQATSAMY